MNFKSSQSNPLNPELLLKGYFALLVLAFSSVSIFIQGQRITANSLMSTYKIACALFIVVVVVTIGC